MIDDPPLGNAHCFDLHRSPIHQLHQLNQRVSEIFEKEIEGSVLTARQFAVLFVVSQNKGLSQSALVQRTGIDRSTLADIVKRMIKKGYISRRRLKEDARAYSVKITDSGLQAIRLAEPVIKRINETILSALPQQSGGDRFFSDLGAILEVLETKTKKVSSIV